jgi:hypothetical protein
MCSDACNERAALAAGAASPERADIEFEPPRPLPPPLVVAYV